MTWWQQWAMPASELGPAQGPIPGLPETMAPRVPIWWIGPIPWLPAPATSTPVDLQAPPATDLPVIARRERDTVARPEPIPMDGGGLAPPPLPGAPGGFNIFDVRRTVQTVGTAGAVTGNPAVAGAARVLDFVLSLFTPRQPAAPTSPVAPVDPTAPAPTGAAIGAAPPPVIEDQLLLPAPEPVPGPVPTRERDGDTRTPSERFTQERSLAGFRERSLELGGGGFI